MTDDRTIATIVHPTPQPGTGVLHPFPTRELPHVDPFVFLDTGAPMDLGDSDIFVAPHPHRGVQPVSLLFRGRIEHRDSLGNDRTVTSGGIQWLVAGSGALHEEVLNGDDDGIFHMAQLWINLPARLKLTPPSHHALPTEDVPELTSLGEGAVVRLYAGELAGSLGPAPLPTPVLLAHVTLGSGSDVAIPVPRDWSASICVVAGVAQIGDEQRLAAGATVVFAEDGDWISATSEEGAQLLVMAGEPLAEPIAMGGGFVMNTTAEIDEAFADYSSGRMGSLTSSR